MEQNFQTSFIPKKPIVENRSNVSRPTSIFVVISIFILFTIAIASGGLYFYKLSIEKNITQMSSDLNLAKNRFEPSKIVQLQRLDKRLRASSELLSRHVALSPIFEALESLTMKSVRYTKFSYSLVNDKTSTMNITLSGQAVGYRSIALQSDLFKKNKQIIDPVFSNLTLDNSGNVVFDLAFTVDAALINYVEMITSPDDQNSAQLLDNPTLN